LITLFSFIYIFGLVRATKKNLPFVVYSLVIFAPSELLLLSARSVRTLATIHSLGGIRPEVVSFCERSSRQNPFAAPFTHMLHSLEKSLIKWNDDTSRINSPSVRVYTKPPKSNHNHNERGGGVESRPSRPVPAHRQKEIDNGPIKRSPKKKIYTLKLYIYIYICLFFSTCFRFDAGRAGRNSSLYISKSSCCSDEFALCQ